jgi:hypothetical protein
MNPIKSGSDDPKLLFNFFEGKRLLLLPKRNKEVNNLMTSNNWNRTQLSRQFALWSSLGTLGSLVVTISEEELLLSLDDRCGTTESILDETKRLLFLPLLKPEETDKERLFHIEKWERFGNEYLKLIPRCRATTLSVVDSKAKQLFGMSETLIHCHGEAFSKSCSGADVNNFFQYFVRDLIKQLKISIAKPDVADFEK